MFNRARRARSASSSNSSVSVWAASRAASAVTRSVISRTTTLNDVSSRRRMGAMVHSAGNSSPFIRTARVVHRAPSSGCGRPLHPASSAAPYSGGPCCRSAVSMNGRPAGSWSPHPNVTSACGFHSTMRPRWSRMMKASMVAAMAERSRASLCARSRWPASMAVSDRNRRRRETTVNPNPVVARISRLTATARRTSPQNGTSIASTFCLATSDHGVPGTGPPTATTRCPRLSTPSNARPLRP